MTKVPRRDELKQRGWGKRLKLMALWSVALTTAFHLVDYAMDARLRTTRLPHCQWQDLKPEPYALPYLARWCHLKRDMVVVRLFDDQGQQLLAERTFEYPVVPRVFWSRDKLEFHGAFGSESILLPPTFIDRLRLKLP